ncbi:MAG: aminotransferase class IV [bacterium]|nr:aminotransferase class IV [bacterium]
MRHGEKVVSRWIVDAAALGLGEIDPEVAQTAILRLGLGHFERGSQGIVRLEARTGPDGMLWIGTTRELGPEPPTWRAGLGTEQHPGPRDEVGAKRADRALLDRSRNLAIERGWDEALLVDREGFAVEGTRSNLIVALATGQLVTPPIRRGAVRGIARGILLDSLPELEEADVAGRELDRAEELIAVNSVRGARPIVALGDRPIAGGSPGPWAAQLSLLLDANA